MDKVLLILAAVMVLALLACLGAWRRKRKMEAVFAGRDGLSAEAFHERYFRERGVSLAVVAGVRQVLEEQLGADLSRLQADDDFSRNISFFWDFDSLANVEIVCALEQKFDIEILDEEAVAAVTVFDLVHLVSSKVRLASDAAMEKK